MEALLVSDLPARGEWQYEPKWDGFRGVLENDTGELALWSRNGRPLLRYFPELRPLGDLLPPHSALDGEIILEQEGRLDFDALQLRLHPAESRIRRLAQEIPVSFVAFDLLLWQGEPVHRLPLERRREELLHRAQRFQTSPASRDVARARGWLERLETAGLDGVVCKRLGLPYLSGSRDGVVKVKRRKTADCVIVGYRSNEAGSIATLLLGLYRDDGTLDFVGHTSGLTAPLRAQLKEMLVPLAEEGHLGGGRIPGAQSRWSRGRDLDWTEVRPEVVCEVSFDKLEGDRIRHGARFLRFRPDKSARECTWSQVRPPRSAEDLDVPSLLGRAPVTRGGGAR
jgi:ATP-dependent DNA ligase